MGGVDAWPQWAQVLILVPFYLALMATWYWGVLGDEQA